MQTYKSILKGKGGETQEIHFVKMRDLPVGFLEDQRRTMGMGGKRIQIEGLEVVWDIDTRQFRYINWNAIRGTIKKSDFIVDIDSVLL